MAHRSGILSTTILGWLLAAGSLPAQSVTPAPTLELGAEFRLRWEDWDNNRDFNGTSTAAPSDSQVNWRFRGRGWAKWNPTPNLEIMAGIATEPRKITRPDVSKDYREVFFDTLYMDYKFNPDWSVKIGRQNLMLGEGFIVFEGSPREGSRSLYLNAIDITRKFGHSKVEFLAISNPKREKYLPVLNEAPYPPPNLIEWDEQALGLYYTNQEWKDTTLEGYYFLKTEKNDYRPTGSAGWQPDRTIHTLGSRAVKGLGSGWSLNGEFAYQWGRQDGYSVSSYTMAERWEGCDIGAWGGYAKVKKSFDPAWKPSVSFGYIGLSGDDPNTSTDENWDPLFSRWPKWSELFVVTQINEKGVSYWTNTSLWELEFKCSPASFLDLRGTYYKMSAYEAPFAPSATFGTGKSRGDLWEVRADYRIGPSVKGHLVYEHLDPGNFYAQQDAAFFLRFEIGYTFKAKF